MEKERNFEAHLIGNTLSSNSKKAYTLSKEGFFGEKKSEKIFYSFSEGLFLMKNKGMKIIQNKNPLTETEASKKFLKIDKRFPIKYKAYEELRKKGFILKSAIKYGADFLVYEKGKKPGTSHSSWILSVEDSSKNLKIEEFILKNRVANSTRKRVLLGILDSEGNIIYYEVNWKKI